MDLGVFLGNGGGGSAYNPCSHPLLLPKSLSVEQFSWQVTLPAARVTLPAARVTLPAARVCFTILFALSSLSLLILLKRKENKRDNKGKRAKSVARVSGWLNFVLHGLEPPARVNPCSVFHTLIKINQSVNKMKTELHGCTGCAAPTSLARDNFAQPGGRVITQQWAHKRG